MYIYIHGVYSCVCIYIYLYVGGLQWCSGGFDFELGIKKISRGAEAGIVALPPQHLEILGS